MGRSPAPGAGRRPRRRTRHQRGSSPRHPARAYLGCWVRRKRACRQPETACDWQTHLARKGSNDTISDNRPVKSHDAGLGESGLTRSTPRTSRRLTLTELLSLLVPLDVAASGTTAQHRPLSRIITRRYLTFLAVCGYTLAAVERRACGQDPLPVDDTDQEHSPLTELLDLLCGNPPGGPVSRQRSTPGTTIEPLETRWSPPHTPGPRPTPPCSPPCSALTTSSRPARVAQLRPLLRTDTCTASPEPRHT